MASFLSLSNLFLQFLCLFLFFFSDTYGIQQPLCNDADRFSLLQFKQSFVFDEFACDPYTDYTKLTSWNVSDDCCSWDGVDCDDLTGHVIGLDLSDSCLFGSINSSSPLFRLVHLKSLNLSHNSFNFSTIPDGISSLSELTHLNLSLSDFFGQIPSEILELSNLVSLLLSGNPLVLQKPSLKDVAETLTNLKELELSGVNISSNVPHSLSGLTSLTSLFLKNCSLQGEFPPAIFQLPNLCNLSLRYNPDLIGYLPEFQVGSPLEALWIEGTTFRGQIPLSIGSLKSLRYFHASGCGFGGKIPSSIGNLTKLNFLDLSNNSFSGQLPLSIGNLIKLDVLDLSNNNFSGQLPLSIGNLTKLDYLDLSSNYFSRNIPSSISNLLQLTILSLDHNNFSSGTLGWLDKLTNLQSLDLTSTNSYGPIPSSFQNLTQLQELWFEDNQLTGQVPSWLGNFTQLTILILPFNKLQGPIPDSIFRLPNIQVVDLHSNNLSGSLRFDSFLQSKYLSMLYLSMNHLTLVSNTYNNVTLPKFQSLGFGHCNLTEFPAFLHEQHQLEALDLSENGIKGYVPNWIFTWESLRFLNLGDNFLTHFEHSPNDTLLWSKLIALNLTINELEGPLPIPPPSIAIYDVSQNKFSENVSPLFCNFTSLLVLDLSNNNLSGNLPPCLANLGTSALVLDLRNNSLSGSVSDNFTSGCALKLMDFSQNKIKGEVPRSLVNCSSLEILNLEKNEMNDVFPSWLGVLPRLKVLSLKSNKLHGDIGQPLRRFEFNGLQIIDISDNSFTGKLPLEYFRKWFAMKSVNINDHLAYMTTTISLPVDDYIVDDSYMHFISIVNKGIERAYDRIPKFFVVVDLSSNQFKGEIPEMIGTLKALNSLNLSNNMLTGHIPSSLVNLKELEALDLSRNELSGEIPAQLSVLTYLSIFNVSQNNLTGRIPQGNQFGTFQNDSFLANPGLCGIPLSKRCGGTGTSSVPPSEDEDEESPLELNWQIVLIGLGSGLVIGLAFGFAMDTRKYEWLVSSKFARWRRSRRN